MVKNSPNNEHELHGVKNTSEEMSKVGITQNIDNISTQVRGDVAEIIGNELEEPATGPHKISSTERAFDMSAITIEKITKNVQNVDSVESILAAITIVLQAKTQSTEDIEKMKKAVIKAKIGQLWFNDFMVIVNSIIDKSQIFPPEAITAFINAVDGKKENMITFGDISTYASIEVARGEGKGTSNQKVRLSEKEVAEGKADPYIAAELGSGGMGKVRIAYTFFPEFRQLVIKESTAKAQALAKEFAEHEANAAEVIMRLKKNHPNETEGIITPIGVSRGKTNYIAYELLEFTEGKSFKMKMDGKDLFENEMMGFKPLSAKDKLESMTQFFETVKFLLQQGYVHRDLKPHNIVYTRNEEGKVKAVIIDPGLMISTNDESLRLPREKIGEAVTGTAPYQNMEDNFPQSGDKEERENRALGANAELTRAVLTFIDIIFKKKMPTKQFPVSNNGILSLQNNAERLKVMQTYFTPDHANFLFTNALENLKQKSEVKPEIKNGIEKRVNELCAILFATLQTDYAKRPNDPMKIFEQINMILQQIVNHYPGDLEELFPI